MPYSSVNNFELENYLDQGRRLMKPQFCPKSIYQLWLKCWSFDQDERPSFSDITKTIKDFIIKVHIRSNATEKSPQNCLNVANNLYYNEKIDKIQMYRKNELTLQIK